VDDKGDTDSRIIVLSRDSLVEADVITGVNVLTLALKHLVRVEDVTSKYLFRLIGDRYRLRSNTDLVYCYYCIQTDSQKYKGDKVWVQLEFRNSLTDRTQYFVCT